MNWYPLTAELAVKRMVALSYAVDDEHGPIEEILFQIVRCDECGATADLCTLEPDIARWITSGDLLDGFKDLCPACAAKANLTATPSQGV